ncbi:YrhB domain-containing protein [Tenacibaculum xiamenense]|uniref:YrhB domain-containing protein n=1 Tax=Tenacibaculum xiamenense TaxID=1261553 RepID=UPI00389507C4
MLTNSEMLEIAKKYLRKINGSEEDKLVVISQLTVEKPYGNVYSYNFQKFIETGNRKYSVATGIPFLVEKETGRVVNFSSSGHLESHLKDYENGTMSESLDLYWYPDEDRYDYK